MKDLLLLDMQEVGFAGISVSDSHLGAVVHFSGITKCWCTLVTLYTSV